MKYRAEKHSDGTYTIHGVPVFSEVPAGAKANEKPIDRTWMQKAVDAAAKLEKDNNYLPPLHIGHHKREGANVQPAGHFRLRGVERMNLDGTEKDVLIADLVKVPESVFNDIKAGKYPYRSVEVIKWDEGRLNHLALLSHEEPFFKFPLLNGETLQIDPKELSAFNYARDGDGIAALFAEEIDTMKARNPKNENPTVEDRLDKLEGMFEEILGRFDALEDGSDPQEFSVEDLLDEVEQTLEDLEGAEFANDEEREDVEAALAELDECLEDLEAELAAGDIEPPQPAEIDGSDSRSSLKKLASVEGRVAALEQDRNVTTLVTDAVEHLEGKGYHLTDKVKEKVIQFAEMGEEPLAAFVESYKMTARKDPTGLDEDDDANFASDPVVAELKLDPEDAEIAFSLAKEWDANPHGIQNRVPKKDYIACNIEARRAQMTA